MAVFPIEPLPGWKNYRLLKTVHIQGIEVPEGFVCDLTSVPRIFWFLIRPAGKYAGGALPHDYIYRGHVPETTRLEADLVMLKQWLEDGCNETLATVAFWFVRKFSKHAWRGDPALGK